MSDLEQRKVFSDNLTRFLETYHKTQKEVADAIHVSPQTFNTWVHGKAIPRMGKVQLLADYFNVPKSYLIDVQTEQKYHISFDSNIHPIAKKRFHVLGSVACGEPILMENTFETFIDLLDAVSFDFVLVAKGDSMINAGIHDGDAVFVKSQDMVENGQIAVVAIDDEATLKRLYWYKEKDLLVLRAENPKYEDMIFTESSAKNIRVLGRAMAYQTLIR